MTVLSVLLWWASLHVQYAIYRASRADPTVAEDTGSNRSETRPSVSQ